MRQWSIILFVIILFSNALPGQINLSKQKNENKFFELGVIEELQSKELSETRTLNIYLPEIYYQDTNSAYPVIYLLDGSANEDFIHIVGVVQFLSMIGAMPVSIVIGIANVDRKRDFTFPTTIEKDRQDFPTTGGSAKFMAFIEKELHPFIQKEYRTNSDKTIIGQSLGGLLATEVLLKKPDLFNRYIIVSPSLWWDNESLLSSAPQLLKRQADEDIQVYISVGTEGKQMEEDAKKLADVLQASGVMNLKVSYVPLPEENHLTILHNSVYKAFEIMNLKK